MKLQNPTNVVLHSILTNLNDKTFKYDDYKLQKCTVIFFQVGPLEQ